MNNQFQHSNECLCFSWKPIIAGALMAVGLSFLLNLFSVAIGVHAYSSNSDGVESLAMGGLIATAIGIVSSMFASGWLAGYLGQRYCGKRHLGAFYGFITWCVALIIVIFLASHVQQYISFYSHFISGTMDTLQVSAATATSKVTGNIPADKLVVSTYIIFCLFFLSAFSCSLGGHCGMRHTCKENI